MNKLTNSQPNVHNAMQDYTEQDQVKRKYLSLWENKVKSENNKLNAICWKEVENFLWGLAASGTIILMALAYVIFAGV